MNDVKIKQQIIEKIKASSNILVTVSVDPSVDALSAALGLTVMLNKLGKHATAVFSGAIPPAITFLDPQKTFEATTNSLRDFIIALDKEKADHLRYKVEGDVVKIFITPYRTTITSDDLEFSQGDYNVELVLALGVDNQDHLDNALEAQGRILHDATVVTLSAGDQTSSLGGLDWHDGSASSLSEMLVALTDGLKSDKDKEPLLDNQIATALMTGIVAETDRFSNNKTSSKVMTVAAELMAAGADQQLIAAKLQESHEFESPSGSDSGMSSSLKIEKTPEPAAPVEPEANDSMSIMHTDGLTLDDIAKEVHEKDQAEAAQVAEQAVEDLPQDSPPVLTPVTEDTIPPIEVAHAYALEPEVGVADSAEPVSGEPTLGGTLNATSEQAAEDARKERESDQNKTILSHAYLSESPANTAPMNGQAEASAADIFTGPSAALETPSAPVTNTIGEMIIAPLNSAYAVEETRDDATRDDALAAVNATFSTTAPQPAPAPSPAPFSPAPGITLPPPPPLPDFSQLPPMPAATSAYAPEQSVPATERLGDIFPDPQTPPVLSPASEPTPPPAPTTNDPGQFIIPGQ